MNFKKHDPKGDLSKNLLRAGRPTQTNGGKGDEQKAEIPLIGMVVALISFFDAVMYYFLFSWPGVVDWMRSNQWFIGVVVPVLVLAIFFSICLSQSRNIINPYSIIIACLLVAFLLTLPVLSVDVGPPTVAFWTMVFFNVFCLIALVFAQGIKMCSKIAGRTTILILGALVVYTGFCMAFYYGYWRSYDTMPKCKGVGFIEAMGIGISMQGAVAIADIVLARIIAGRKEENAPSL